MPLFAWFAPFVTVIHGSLLEAVHSPEAVTLIVPLPPLLLKFGGEIAETVPLVFSPPVKKANAD
jgi:hypothetical protein